MIRAPGGASQLPRRGVALPIAALLIAIAGFMHGAEAAPADAPFTIGNYPVEARADNAAAAKDRALADGQSSAFRSLLKRLVPVTAHARLRTLKVAKPGDMIEGIRVRSERNSSTEYLASLDFSFQPRAVRALLQREGLPFVDQQAPELTVIPAWRGAANTPPKDEATWTNVWKGLDLQNALSPVKLQVITPKISPDALAALANGDGTAVRSLAAATNSELVIVALAEPDPSTRRLNVTLSGRDAVGAFTLKRAYRIDANDPNYAAELAGVVSMGILEGRWKAVAANSGSAQQPGPSAGVEPGPQPGPGGFPAREPSAGPPPSRGGGGAMQASVEFRNMGEWQEISRKISAVPGVEGYDVAGLSARSARVTFRYGQSPDRLASELEQQGLSMRNAGGAWIIGAR